ncbi:hypothetical protein GCM10009647_083140 [Streptomyces sanglieri]
MQTDGFVIIGVLPDLARNDNGRWKYSHTQWEITSTGYRCPLYDGGVLPTGNPLHRDQPEDHPTRSANVTVPLRGMAPCQLN